MNSKKWSKSYGNNVRFLPVTATYTKSMYNINSQQGSGLGPAIPVNLISHGCGQLNLICILLYAGAHDHASLPSTVSHVIRRAKL